MTQKIIDQYGAHEIYKIASHHNHQELKEIELIQKSRAHAVMVNKEIGFW